MEFLRFGSKIPGIYWGCCAVCIIQNFKFDPDEKYSMQLVSGDSGHALTFPHGHKNAGKQQYVGPTYRDIFKARIRIGTHTNRDMPNHTFLAVLTESQVSGGVGAKWLQILKEEGFEFLRCTDNSVYTGADIDGGKTPHRNYIFGLFRNISGARVPDPFTPPKAWTDLEGGMPGVLDVASARKLASLAKEQTEFQRERWKAGETVFMTEEELLEAGAPIMKAGVCTTPPSNITEEVKRRLAGKSETAASPFPPVPQG